MLVPYTARVLGYEQLVNSQPNGSATPGTVARLTIPAGASLGTQPKAAVAAKARLQLGTATQHRLP